MLRRIKWCIVFVMILLSVFISSALADKTGRCGSNIRWTLTDDQILTITGKGWMDDFDSGAPWGKKVREVIVSNGVTSIGWGAFFGCENLTKVTLPNSIKTFGEFCFFRCKNLTSITIPSAMTSINHWCFAKSGLTTIYIPDNITSIDHHAFELCSNLKQVSLPEHVYIDASVFYGTALTDVYYRGTEQSWERYCSRDFNNSDVSPYPKIHCYDSLPANLLEIGFDAFNGTALDSVIIPNGCLSIGNRAFANNDELVYAQIPSSVTHFGKDIFLNSPNVKKDFVR